ncbi:MAG: aminopeptidase P family N-terminal domain-containing protein, partial [Candidatus Daviesbacteria bacterium]|nr:aminopeptidase P family N-terminal domain-containing protein [Candidatus Daviesbacteria bacterium]
MFRGRITRIQQQLTKNNLDAVLVSSVSNISYLTGFTNFSKDEREAYIFIGRDFAYIITDARYSEAVRKQVSHLTLFERSHRNPTKNLFKKHRKEIKRLGVEEDNLTVAEHKSLNKHFKKTKHFDVGNLRSIKTKDEISKIEKACQIGDLAFAFILKKIRVGVTEEQVAGELENFIRTKGAVISFP